MLNIYIYKENQVKYINTLNTHIAIERDAYKPLHNFALSNSLTVMILKGAGTH